MEAKQKRNIKNGAAYNGLFPAAQMNDTTLIRNAGVADTVALIPKVVQKYAIQTRALSQRLKGNTLNQTCTNIWQFVYDHIAYAKDKDGYEQIRSPARAWHDRRTGIDCDCYSTFISSILTNLGIPHTLRITKYEGRDYFQHIYPIVPTGNGNYITMDCVTDQYNYEVPYTEKKDYPMELQILSGIDGAQDYRGGYDGMAELGKIVKKRAAGQSNNKSQKKADKKQARVVKKDARKAKRNDPANKKKGFKKILNVVNKANPATLAMRNGILAATKLNIGKLGSRLRWSYLTPADAAKKGIDPEKFKQLVAVRLKLENILYSSGGNPANLKKAVISGKGNKDKAVHGLGYLDADLTGVDYLNEYTPLHQLLGSDIFRSENTENGALLSGFGALGEPATLASIAAASGVIATIVGMLKKVGDIFKGKGKGADDFSEQANSEADKDVTKVSNSDGSAPANTGGDNGSPAPQSNSSSGDGGVNTGKNNAGGDNSSAPAQSSQQDNNSSAVARSSYGGGSADSSAVATTNNGGSPAAPDGNAGPGGADPAAMIKSGDSGTPDKGSADGEGGTGGKPAGDSLWEKNKSWLKPTLIGVGALAAIGTVYLLTKSPHPHEEKAKPVHGLPGNKQNHQRKNNKSTSKPKSKPKQKTEHKEVNAISLL